MQHELTGKLFDIFDTIQRTEKFKVREFVVETKETAKDKSFSQLIKFQASNERTSVLDNMSIGDEVKVHFNIKGSKWDKNGKTSYFNNLDAWKIEQLSKAAKKEFIEEAELVEPADDLPF
jgi:hypothetical protein